MFVPSAARRREIREDIRRFLMVWRAAQAYAEAGEAQTAAALVAAIPRKKCPPKEQEWHIRNAIQRAMEIEREEAKNAAVTKH
jgi:hypothetical protein